MIASEIKLYELLKARIGEKEAAAFVDILEKKVDQKFEDKKSGLATQQDMADLREDFANLKTDVSRTIYLTSLGQLLAIVGSVISLVYLLKK